MPRIRTIPPQEASGELAQAYEEALEKVGMPIIPSVFHLASLRPDIVRHLAEGYGLMFRAGRLPRATKEAIATWVSELNQCPYCTEAHATSLQLTGGTQNQVDAARSMDAEAFSDDAATRRFLGLTEKITRHAYKVTDEDIEGLREAGWDDEQVLEAVHVATIFNAMNRLADTLGLKADDFMVDARQFAQVIDRDDKNTP